MQTASGQAVKDSSNRDKGGPRRGPARRKGLSPMVLGLAAFLLVLSLAVMIVNLAGIWPPKPKEASMTIAEQWRADRTATPGTQSANGLKVDKVGSPVHSGDTVTVTLKVTNNVVLPGPTPSGGGPAGPDQQANVYSGFIRVIFYNVENGRQKIVGGGNGTVVNLKYGDSQTITVVSTPVQNYSDATQYEAFPDSVWTDKDPVKATPQAGAQSGTQSPNATP